MTTQHVDETSRPHPSPSPYTPRILAGMADAMIRVPEGVRDRLAVLAEARGTSIRALIQEFAESTLTPEEREQRAERARSYIAEHFGVDVTPEDEARVQRKLDAAHLGQTDGGTAA